MAGVAKISILGRERPQLPPRLYPYNLLRLVSRTQEKVCPMKKIASMALSGLLAFAAFGCAMPPQANDRVETPLPDSWKDQVLMVLAERTLEDGIKYDENGVAFADAPRPCVFSPTSGRKDNRPDASTPTDRRDAPETILGHCGSLIVTPSGRSKLPPANYLYIFQESGDISFIRQD